MADDKNPETPNRAEWERERAAELEARDKTALAVKVAQLEYDLKHARTERDEARSLLPKEGERVLKKSELEAYEAYQKLGKPEEIAETVKERDTLKVDKQKSDWRQNVSDAAKAAKMRANVLEKLLPEGSALEVKSVTADGKTLEVAYVKDADGKEYKLAEYMEAQHKDFLPALMEADAKPAPAQTWVPAGKPATTTGKTEVNPIAQAVAGNATGEVKAVSLFSKSE